MTESDGHKLRRRRFEPARRPFVWRPLAIASMLLAPVVLAALYFWERVELAVGAGVYVVPGAAVAVLVLLAVDRLVRLRKTEYRLQPDRVVVKTGSLLGERTTELDLENVTLVEWTSPFLMRVFYGVGHVTIEEAGSSSHPARMFYVDDPEELYDLITDYMEARGFSLARSRVVQEQEPGHLGASVDFVERHIEWIGTLGILSVNLAPELMTLQFAGIVGVLSEIYRSGLELVRTTGFGWAGILVVSGLLAVVGLLVGVVWVATTYVDLLRRRYTLHDDVIDYADGFLTETRKFVPLENVADTEVARPVHKRLLGLSDVTLSPEGSNNEIRFSSTPEGPAFAEAIDRLLRESPREASSESPSDEVEVLTEEAQGAESRSTTGSAELEEPLSPQMVRAASRGAWAAPLAVMALIPFVLETTESAFYLGPVEVAGLFGLVGALSAVVMVSVVGGAAWWVVSAWASEFRIGDREVTASYRLFGTNETRFGLDRITSVSIVKRPLDWLIGTMTVHFRSVGSDEEVTFWSIEDASRTRRSIRERLELPTSDYDADGQVDLTPRFRFGDAFRALAPLQSAVGVGWVVLVAVGSLVGLTSGAGWWIGAGLLYALVVAGWHAVRGIRHRVKRGAVFDDHLELEEGLLRRRRHLVPLDGVKALAAHRYPGSDAGRLELSTPGFLVRVDHLRAVEQMHVEFDDRLGEGRAADGELVRERPHAGTLALQSAWTLLFGVGLVVVPAVYLYYRRVAYRAEAGRLVAEYGIYFDRRKTVQFGRVDHIETDRTLVQYLTDTHTIEVYTVGSPSTELAFHSIPRSRGMRDAIRRRLDFE